MYINTQNEKEQRVIRNGMNTLEDQRMGEHTDGTTKTEHNQQYMPPYLNKCWHLQLSTDNMYVCMCSVNNINNQEWRDPILKYRTTCGKHSKHYLSSIRNMHVCL